MHFGAKQFITTMIAVMTAFATASCGETLLLKPDAAKSDGNPAVAPAKNSADAQIGDGGEPSITETEQIQSGPINTNNQASGPGTDHSDDQQDTVEGSSLRLLRPEELKTKTATIFGVPWNVTLQLPTDTNPGGTTNMNGFDAYAGNLNGIDYNQNNTYSQVGSATWIATHEKFCTELAAASFADATSRASWFTSATPTETMASNRSAVERNLGDVWIRMFAVPAAADSAEMTLVRSLYSDLERQPAAARNNKHPLELTVRALCFSSRFVHAL